MQASKQASERATEEAKWARAVSFVVAIGDRAAGKLCLDTRNSLNPRGALLADRACCALLRDMRSAASGHAMRWGQHTQRGEGEREREREKEG